MTSSSLKLPRGFLERAQEELRKRAVRTLKDIGDRCVAVAVENGSYKDQTGNLRSSIGYVVSIDGVVVEEGGFWAIGQGDGVSVGRSKARSLASGTRGLRLIIVAGMDYAQYVADKGYDVLDSAELIMRRLISQLG